MYMYMIYSQELGEWWEGGWGLEDGRAAGREWWGKVHSSMHIGTCIVPIMDEVDIYSIKLNLAVLAIVETPFRVLKTFSRPRPLEHVVRESLLINIQMRVTL